MNTVRAWRRRLIPTSARATPAMTRTELPRTTPPTSSTVPVANAGTAQQASTTNALPPSSHSRGRDFTGPAPSQAVRWMVHLLDRSPSRRSGRHTRPERPRQRMGRRRAPRLSETLEPQSLRLLRRVNRLEAHHCEVAPRFAEPLTQKLNMRAIGKVLDRDSHTTRVNPPFEWRVKRDTLGRCGSGKSRWPPTFR